MWSIEWSGEAQRDILGIEKKIAERIVRKLDSIVSDPMRYFERQVGSDEYKLRVGDWRVLALFYYDKKIIWIEKVDHRKNIYKKS